MEYGKGIEMLENQLFGEYFAEREPADLAPLQIAMTEHDAVGIRPCHDIYIGVKERGVLTIVRDRKPALNERWPIGGGMYRGFSTRDSIEKMVNRECGLTTTGNAVMLGSARIVSNYHRENKSIGMDSTAWVFYVDGTGQLNLDADHKSPMFTKPEDLTSKFADSLHPYVRDFLPKAVEVYKRKIA
jgi:hypothetical protein